MYDNKNKSFYTIAKDYLQMSKTVGYSTPLLSYNVVLDEKVFTVSRRVQTLVDALAETGGLMGIVLSLAALLLKGT